MKIKNKFLAGALLTVASLGIVGSISGTYAWYSYNTKDNIAYHGIASGNSQNLEVRILDTEKSSGHEWGNTISQEEIVASSYANGYAGDLLQPVSFMKTNTMTGDSEHGTNPAVMVDGDFHGRPDEYTNEICASDKTPLNVKDDAGNYTFLRVDFQIRSVNKAGSSATTVKCYEQQVYLSDVRCYSTSTKRDMSSAVRLYLGNANNATLIAPGDTSTNDSITTNLYGTQLYSDAEGQKGIVKEQNTADITGYTTYKTPLGQTEMSQATNIEYGVHGVTETAMTPNKARAQFTNGKHVANTGITLGKTSSNPDSPLTITMYVYLQGWDASCKDSEVGAEFDLGFTIQTDRITANEGVDKLVVQKEDAITELESYKGTETWAGEAATAREQAITDGKAAINEATNKEGVDAALAAAKTIIAKLSAKTELSGMNAGVDPSVLDAVNAAISNGVSAIESATTVEGVESALQEAKDAIDAIINPVE